MAIKLLYSAEHLSLLPFSIEIEIYRCDENLSQKCRIIIAMKTLYLDENAYIWLNMNNENFVLKTHWGH